MAQSSVSQEVAGSEPLSPPPPPPPPPVAPVPLNRPATARTLEGVGTPGNVEAPSPKPAPANPKPRSRPSERWRGKKGPGENNVPSPHSSSPTADVRSEESELLKVEQSAPAWLLSLIVHLVALLLLALLTITGSTGAGALIIELGKSEEASDIDLTSFALAGPETPNIQEVVEDPVEVEQDLVIQEVSKIEPIEMITPVDNGTVSIDLASMAALSGRNGAMKDALLAAYGGTQATQDAVAKGLAWLKRNQLKNGAWSLSGRYLDGSRSENLPAATAMALIAFQGDGNTHMSGEYSQQVAAGMKWLVNQQDRDGSFVTKSRVPSHASLYAQGQCMIAICELYAMTKDSWLREPAQRALDYAAEIQSREGGWRYNPGQGADTSVTGWFMMGLKSGRMAGLEVDESVFDKINYYLDSVSHTDPLHENDPAFDGAAYSYLPNEAPSPAMTAEAMLCRQYLGWERDRPAMRTVALTINESHPFDYDQRNFYYWYYATQVLHHYGGSYWREWNSLMREQLPAAQVKTGKESGSWSPQGSRWGNSGGRLYTTCLAIYCLEVYYRHMPLYAEQGK